MPGKHVDFGESLKALRAVALVEMTVLYIP
jgi:hypothetical protein